MSRLVSTSYINTLLYPYRGQAKQNKTKQNNKRKKERENKKNNIIRINNKGGGIDNRIRIDRVIIETH